MATYILLDENRRSFTGTDTFIYIDGRLSVDGKIRSAKEYLTRMVDVKPRMVREVKYMIKYSSAQYDYNTYQYSGKLIPLT